MDYGLDDDDDDDDWEDEDDIDATVTIFEYGTHVHNKVIKFRLNDLDGDPLSYEDVEVEIFRRGDEDDDSVYFDYLTTNENGVATLKWSDDDDLGYGYFTIKATAFDSTSEEVTLENVRVLKSTVYLKAAKQVLTYGSGKTFNVMVVDNTGKGISGIKVRMVFYTGNKAIRTVVAKTNAYGYAYYKASTLPAGLHKVVVSGYDYRVAAKVIVSSVKVNKMSLRLSTYNKYFRDCGEVHMAVANLATKKLLNGIKLNIKVYTGSRYKSYYVNTGYEGKLYRSNGIAILASNAFSVGNHKVLITIVSDKCCGSAWGLLKILPSAKSYGQYTALISNNRVRYVR